MKDVIPNDPQLLIQIQAEIDRIAAIADEFPGVIIIHNNLDLSVVYMSKRGSDMLGISLDELIAMGPLYHDRFFNPEEAVHYVPKIKNLLERNDPHEWVSFFQQMHTNQNEGWTWYASTCKILMRDDIGRPVLNITIALPLDAEHHISSKVDRLQKENEFLRKHYNRFARLSKREKEILQLTVLGKSAAEIADELHISSTTVDTHRRNLKKKLNTDNSFELSQYALAFDLI